MGVTVVVGVPLVGFLGSFVQVHRVYGFDGLAVEIDVYWRVWNSVLIIEFIYPIVFNPPPPSSLPSS